MSEFKTHAVMALSNWGGVAIQINESGDYVRYKWYDEKPSRWRAVFQNIWSKIFFVRFYASELLKIIGASCPDGH